MSLMPTGSPWYCPHTALMNWLGEAGPHDWEHGWHVVFWVALHATAW